MLEIILGGLHDTCKAFGTIIIGWAFNMKLSGMTSLMEIKMIIKKLLWPLADKRSGSVTDDIIPESISPHRHTVLKHIIQKL